MEMLPHEKQIVEYEKTIAEFKEHHDKEPLFSQRELQSLEEKLDKLKAQVYGKLTPWDRVLICRHPNRPRTSDYIAHITEEFHELAGDRTFRDDLAVVGGFAKIGGVRCVLIGQEKGRDTESRLHHNFGMLHPEGFRKALRLAEMAEKFALPVVLLVDTPGAFPGLAAEERGQGRAIALNLRELFRIKTPLIVVLIGEGCSGGALGMGIGDAIGMLEHSYYSVISPEGCASILWKDPKKKSDAAATLRMQAEDLLRFEIIDEIIKEPLGGAHHQPSVVYAGVKDFILKQIEATSWLSTEELLDKRYLKFRNMGAFSTDETSTQSSSTQ